MSKKHFIRITHFLPENARTKGDKVAKEFEGYMNDFTAGRQGKMIEFEVDNGAALIKMVGPDTLAKDLKTEMSIVPDVEVELLSELVYMRRKSLERDIRDQKKEERAAQGE
jgi:hypothetical protein